MVSLKLGRATIPHPIWGERHHFYLLAYYRIFQENSLSLKWTVVLCGDYSPSCIGKFNNLLCLDLLHQETCKRWILFEYILTRRRELVTKPILQKLRD